MERFNCTFDIPGRAVAKQSTRIGFNTKTGKARSYPDKRVVSYEAFVVAVSSSFAPPAPLEGPVRVDLLALFGRPLRMLDRKKKTGELKCGQEGRVPYPQTPDREQVSKGILDAMTRVGFWRDDRQVTDGEITKRYCAIGEVPRVIVTVSWPVEDDAS